MKKTAFVFMGLMLSLAAGFVPESFGQVQSDISTVVLPYRNCPEGSFARDAGFCKEAPLVKYASDITLAVTPQANCAWKKFDERTGICNEAPFVQFASDITNPITPAASCPSKRVNENTGECR